MIKISPSIMCADFCCLGNEISKLEKAGADIFHFDIMDGVFVPNITMGPVILRSLRNKTKIPFEVHLMLSTPEKFIREFVNVGADILIFHIESTQFPHRLINDIKREKRKVGVAINPRTPVSYLETIMNDLDLVLVMTVEPGFAGGNFIPSTIQKVSEIKQMINKQKLNVEIEVDGGINEKTIPSLVNAGANILVCGSTSIFKNDRDYKKNINYIRKISIK